MPCNATSVRHFQTEFTISERERTPANCESEPVRLFSSAAISTACPSVAILRFGVAITAWRLASPLKAHPARPLFYDMSEPQHPCCDAVMRMGERFSGQVEPPHRASSGAWRPKKNGPATSRAKSGRNPVSSIFSNGRSTVLSGNQADRVAQRESDRPNLLTKRPDRTVGAQD